MMTAPLLKIGDFVDVVERGEGMRAVPLPRFWFVQRIQPLRDWRVEKEANRRGISFFLPKIPVTRISRGRRHLQEWPLFPGLMFVPDFEIGNPALANIDGLGRLLRFGDHPAILGPESVDQIRGLAQILQIPRGKRCKFAAGDPLTIKVGPWAKWIGRFDRLDDKGRIDVLITFMKREIVVTVADDQVEPV